MDLNAAVKILIKKAWLVILGTVTITFGVIISVHSPFFSSRYQINQQVLIKPQQKLITKYGVEKQTDFYTRIPIIANGKNRQRAFQMIRKSGLFKDTSNNNLERSFTISAVPNSGIVNITITTNNLRKGYSLNALLIRYVNQSYNDILGEKYDVEIVSKPSIVRKTSIKKVSIVFGVFSGFFISCLMLLVWESWRVRREVRQYGK